MNRRPKFNGYNFPDLCITLWNPNKFQKLSWTRDISWLHRDCIQVDHSVNIQHRCSIQKWFQRFDFLHWQMEKSSFQITLMESLRDHCSTKQWLNTKEIQTCHRNSSMAVDPALHSHTDGRRHFQNVSEMKLKLSVVLSAVCPQNTKDAERNDSRESRQGLFITLDVA